MSSVAVVYRLSFGVQVGWYHQLNGHESEQAPGVGDGQGSLVCCRPWGHTESDTTEQLNCLTDRLERQSTGKGSLKKQTELLRRK